MFTLTTLNLNGIRSAISKGLEPWLAKTQTDCICVQEIKAQAQDMAGKFEQLEGLQGHFHFADKKGYSGVGIYTRHEPTDVRVGLGDAEIDAEGRYVELRFDRGTRKRSIISCYFPSGSSGDERQQVKYRFLDKIHPHLQALKAEREEKMKAKAEAAKEAEAAAAAVVEEPVAEEAPAEEAAVAEAPAEDAATEEVAVEAAPAEDAPAEEAAAEAPAEEEKPTDEEKKDG